MASELTFDRDISMAKRSIAEITGDTGPEVLRYGFDHGSIIFTFRTRIGVFSTAIGMDGSITVRREEPRSFLPTVTAEPGEDNGSERRVAAMERALRFTGEGYIRSVEGREGGFIVEIGRPRAAPVRVFVDRQGAVRESERPGVAVRLDIR
jgi:hypothetical protein